MENQTDPAWWFNWWGVGDDEDQGSADIGGQEPDTGIIDLGMGAPLILTLPDEVSASSQAPASASLAGAGVGGVAPSPFGVILIGLALAGSIWYFSKG